MERLRPNNLNKKEIENEITQKQNNNNVTAFFCSIKYTDDCVKGDPFRCWAITLLFEVSISDGTTGNCCLVTSKLWCFCLWLGWRAWHIVMCFCVTCTARMPGFLSLKFVLYHTIHWWFRTSSLFLSKIN